MSDTSLITFKAISNFTNALNEIFGKEQRSLALYNRLINKTTIAHEKAINKHIIAFRDFSLKNREAFKHKDHNSFTTYTISYSSKVFIDLSTRLTTGRTIYESFFNGNLCICPQSYGVSEILFPDLSVDTFYMDVPLVEEKCRQLLATWSPDEVKLRRKHAREHAIPKVMIDELKAKSE